MNIGRLILGLAVAGVLVGCAQQPPREPTPAERARSAGESVGQGLRKGWEAAKDVGRKTGDATKEGWQGLKEGWGD